MKKPATEQKPRDFQCENYFPISSPLTSVSQSEMTVGSGAQQIEQSQIHNLSKDIALREFLHWDSVVFAILCNVSILCAMFGVLQAIMAHLGCLVVDGVDEDEDN